MVRLFSYICVLTPLEILAKAKKRVVGVLFLTGLIAGSLCALPLPVTSRAKPPCRSPDRTDELTIFFTGNELGALKPCGCSGGQLGGLDRRSAVFNSVPEQKRLVVDTGYLVETDSEQDLLKFNIIIEAFRLLDYDLVHLTEKDVEIAQNLGLLGNPVVGFISSHHPPDANLPLNFTKKFVLDKEVVAVTIAAFDTKSEPIDRVYQLFPLSVRSDMKSVNILILNTADTADINEITEMGIIDCFIVPADSDEPTVIDDPNLDCRMPLRLPPQGGAAGQTSKSPLVFSVGRFGRYVSKLRIRTAGDKLEFNFSTVPVTEDLPQEKSLVELYRAYQQLVKQANLLEKYPRFILPNGLEYTGSESCKPCHEYEYAEWIVPTLTLGQSSRKDHVCAYATLERVGSQFDPECVVCHVVGMKYESGFISDKISSHLKGVGCESCHGPGSEHIRTLGEEKTTEPKLTCLDCHTPQTSSEYAGNERSFLEKIIHWREPNQPGNVK